MKGRDEFKYPGIPMALDGNTAAIMCERESSDAAGAYPITPSTQMGEYWAEEVAKGHINVSDRPLIFIEPEGEHAAAAVTAGLSMTGLRATNFSSGQGIAYMHESLYAAVGKRLTYVLNIGARAMTKSTLNVHAGHDDYHAIDDTGFFQLFAKNAQHVADLNVIAHRISELSLTPGALAQDGFLTTHLIETLRVPERELIREYLGRPDDIIPCPTPAQKLIYGDNRRRIPEVWDVDNPFMTGIVQNQDSYMQSVAAQRPFFFNHIRDLADSAFEEYYQLTGRRYSRVMTYRADDAEYLLVGQGSVVSSAEAVVDYLRETRKIKVGVVNLVMFRPFPTDLIAQILQGKKGVTILERLDQPLAVDQPLTREIRATLSKCLENNSVKGRSPYPELPVFKVTDIPQIFSGSFGLGSRDLQPEGLIGAVENMLPDGDRKKQFYLSIDFIRDQPISPKQRIHQENILDLYPSIQDLSVKGTENPNLMPKGAITVRFHSIGGWGAITTGKNLSMTLYDLLGYHIKSNPKYGSEKKGQPTTYYLAASPEPIRINCEYYFVDVVLSPDPNVFKHTNALAGLKNGGVFIVQSEKEEPEKVWADIPLPYQKVIVNNNIKVFFIDGFKIAREEATDPELQLRMQGIAFQGAFFAVSPIMQQAKLSEEALLKAIYDQIEHKFGSKGQRIVDDNMRVIRRGFDEVREITDKTVGSGTVATPKSIEKESIPSMVKSIPKSDANLSDIHRFWDQTGQFYQRGMGNDVITDPFIGLSVMPASTTLYRDMTGIRFQHPEWVSQNCTACGDCYTVCPDTAIPGLVSELSDVIDTVIARVKKHRGNVEFLPRTMRNLEKSIRERFNSSDDNLTVNHHIKAAIEEVQNDTDNQTLSRELNWFLEELGEFNFALTRPYYDLHEKKQKGSGGLFSITINPMTCKGCMECVEVCNDNALRIVKQTEESVEQLHKEWDLWLDLPNTPSKYDRIDSLEEKIGPLQTLLLNKKAYLSFASGDGACLGCSEKTVVHLFIATLESLMQPRVEKHIEYLDDLTSRLERHIQLRILGSLDVANADSILKIVSQTGNDDLTIASLTNKLEQEQGSNPIDQEWLRNVTGLLAEIKRLKWKYTNGKTGSGRSNMGICNATGCTSVWGSTYPFNPYPFPWTNHLFQDSTSIAMGIFEGHMAKMADGFKAIRRAELELAGTYSVSEHEDFFKYFNWHQFSDEEWGLCPPVVAVGGDGAMYDIGFQNLSRLMASGKPVKVLVVDTQVYSNTGGQACTSGFIGQVSDMAQFGKVVHGKAEPRKEIGLIAIAHRNTYVMQSTLSNSNHMIEGFIDGLLTRRPALFNLYTTCQPEHGVGDDLGVHQAKLAVESRAYPLFRYNPDLGVQVSQVLDLSGNPDLDKNWPTYTLKYLENDQERTMEVSMTFADFALTEARFRKHFRKAPRDAWNDSMIPLVEFLEMEAGERDGLFPFIWAVDRNQKLNRVMVSKEIVESCEERRDFWILLRSLSGYDPDKLDRVEIERQVKTEIVGKLTQGLMNLVGESPNPFDSLVAQPNSIHTNDSNNERLSDLTLDYSAPWLETDECTSCDECIKINPHIFGYNNDKKAYIKDAQGGPYRDLVLAAEKCTAGVIHPGSPAKKDEKDVEKWIKRGAKYN